MHVVDYCSLFYIYLLTYVLRFICRKQSVLISTHSDQCSLNALMIPRFSSEDSKESEQTGRMYRLILIFAGHTSYTFSLCDLNAYPILL